MDLQSAITEAEARKSELQDKHKALSQQAMELNAQGVQIERDLLGIDGELKALHALKASDGV